MQFHFDAATGKLLGKVLSAVIVAGAVILGLAVLYHANRFPQTDDAEIFANFIGIAPQVEGPLVHLNVRDNQFVKQGTLLFEIDDRPYRYALERAISERATLEGQIVDERRRIAALVSAVSVAQANIRAMDGRRGSIGGGGRAGARRRGQRRARRHAYQGGVGLCE